MQQGYFEDNFVRHFVRRPTRRSPVIHRGQPLPPLLSLEEDFKEIPVETRQALPTRGVFTWILSQLPVFVLRA